MARPEEATRRSRRLRALAPTAVAVVVVAALGLAAGLRSRGTDADQGSRVSTVAGEVDDAGAASSTTTTNPDLASDATADTTMVAPPPTTPSLASSTTTSQPVVEATPAGPRTRIAVDPMNRWTLYFYEISRCAELVVDGKSYPKLLCGAAPAASSDVIGEITTVDTPRGRVLVGTADPRVSSFSSYPRQGGAIFHEGTVGTPPSSPDLHVVAGVIAPQWSDVLVRGGVHHLARLVIAPENRRYARSEVERVLVPPYGEWNAYRKVTSTGYYMGGDQELGFYTGSEGLPCLLYRRFAGLFENVIADGCTSASGGHLPVAALEDISGEYMRGAYIVAAASDVLGQVVVELPDGTTLANLNPYPDEVSGTIAWAQMSHITIPDGVTTVDVVLSKDGREIARRSVAVPGR